jgi:hypothetical protein
MPISWEECTSHTAACGAGFVIAVIILVILLIIAIYQGYSISKTPTVVVASSAPPAPASTTAASAAPAVAVTAAAASEYMTATPYDYDPSVRQLLAYKMSGDPKVSRISANLERMRNSNNENPKLAALLGGGRRGM